MDVVELASGIDALYLSGRGDVDRGFLTRLEELKEAAVDFGAAVPCEIGPSPSSCARMAGAPSTGCDTRRRAC